MFETATKQLAKWARRTKKTIFVSFSRSKHGEELHVGYGSQPTVMSGGVGVPVGFSIHEGGRERSYLVLCFDNDWSGTELARYLGGPTHSYHHGEDDEDAIGDTVASALWIARGSRGSL